MKRNHSKTRLTGDETQDIPRLLAEITALRKELARSRRRAADLEAAINAALSARESGESDPYWYLRDEFAYGRGDAYGA
jgi:hypothetical protein